MFNGGSTSLKYYKRLKIYKNSTNTVSFNPETCEGWSYNWKFVSKVNGVVVFNNYNWSVTTSAHQSAVRSVLRELGIKFIVVDAGQERPENFSKSTVRKLFRAMVDKQIEVDTTKRKDTRAYSWRVQDLKDMQVNLQLVQSLRKDFKLTVAEQNEIIDAAIESQMNELMDRQASKGFKQMSLEHAATNVDEVAL